MGPNKRDAVSYFIQKPFNPDKAVQKSVVLKL